jgi:clorobiocin biosynthesis protein CloN5
MSNAESYVQPIHAFITEEFLEGHGEDLEPDSPLLELGIIDSFSLAEVLAWCERRFGIRVPERELTPDNLASIEALAQLLDRLSSERAPTVHAD